MTRILAVTVLSSLALTASLPAQGQRQQAGPPPPPDPRVGLKPGLTDAGQAALGMELVKAMPKAPGFEAPAGGGGLSVANSDLAFTGTLVVQGNFTGVNFYEIEDPRAPQLRGSMICPGGQGDVSVYGRLLFMSVEEMRGRIDCGVAPLTPSDPARFRGVRIFDITNPAAPKQLAAVQTCRGSHTHSIVPSPKDKSRIYIYGQGTSSVRSADELAGCSNNVDANADPNTALFSIDVIEVPLAAPEKAKIVSRPRIFQDPSTGAISGLWQGGNHGAGTQSSSMTTACHDITVYPALGLAAGACGGNGILLDISDPVHPVRLDDVADPNFAFWHSASFNNDGTKVVFTDEWGGGTQPRCRATDQLSWGADAIFTLTNKRLKFASYYKMPAPQTDQENCVAHNGSLIPIPGRDITVQSWYQGGASVIDFTDPAKPMEIAYFDRGPLDATRLIVGGYWSAYWYNGYIYASEIARGLDVLKLVPTEQMTQNEIDAANLVKLDVLNVQSQPKFTWPAQFVVARAYLDQLARSKGLAQERIDVLNTSMTQLEAMPAGASRREASDKLVALATQLEKDAATAKPVDARRLRDCAGVIKTRAGTLR